ncbi:hypothetical protein LTS08_006788 [Lithohypha guttulata]|nr:hypothetical protein LTS08_006788 [Lithohypha guttulata]
MSKKRPAQDEGESHRSKRVKAKDDEEDQHGSASPAIAPTDDQPVAPTSASPRHETRQSVTESPRASVPAAPADETTTISVQGPGTELQTTSEARRVSIGEAFEPAPVVSEDFISDIAIAREREYQKPLGLPNKGNQCYSNSVLVALMGSDRFQSYLRVWHRHTVTWVLKWLYSFGWAANLRGRKSASESKQALEFFWDTVCFREEDPSAGGDLPSGAWSEHCHPKGEDGNQQDASEFYNWLFETSLDQFDLDASRRKGFEWLTHLRLVRRTECSKCERVERRYPVEPWKVWQVRLPRKDERTEDWYTNLSLDGVIDAAMQEDPEPMNCDECEGEHPAHSFLRIQHPPAVLTISFNRAVQIIKPDLNREQRQKYKNGQPMTKSAITKDLSAVRIPKVLDVSKWLNRHEFGEGSKILYRLASIISHKGTSSGKGHYVSYVRGGTDRVQWYEVNDDKVQGADFRDLSDADAEELSPYEFKHRFVPTVLVYDRDLMNQKIVPGRNDANLEKAGAKLVEQTRTEPLIQASVGEENTTVQDDPEIGTDREGAENYNTAPTTPTGSVEQLTDTRTEAVEVQMVQSTARLTRSKSTHTGPRVVSATNHTHLGSAHAATRNLATDGGRTAAAKGQPLNANDNNGMKLEMSNIHQIDAVEPQDSGTEGSFSPVRNANSQVDRTSMQSFRGTKGPPANIEMSLLIDTHEYRLPTIEFDHYNLKTKRDIDFEANIYVSSKQKGHNSKKLDLAQVFWDAAIEDRAKHEIDEKEHKIREDLKKEGLKDEPLDQAVKKKKAQQLNVWRKWRRAETWSERWKPDEYVVKRSEKKAPAAKKKSEDKQIERTQQDEDNGEDNGEDEAGDRQGES